MPWVHLHVYTDGKVTPCCSNFLHYGRVNEQSPTAIFNGRPIRAFRLRMLEDKKEKRCQSCYQIEAAGGKSIRQDTIERYAGQLSELIQNTDEKGTLKGGTPLFYDLRTSNQCNLRCRTCYHGNSSKWFKEAELLGRTAAPQAKISAFEKISCADYIAETLPGVEEFYFAGGEPLMMEEHWQILDQLIAMKKFNTLLRYNTNLSTLQYKGRNIIPLWQQFDHLALGISIDAFGAAGEYIRKDLRWSKFMENIQTIKTLLPNAVLRFEPTVSLLNIFRLTADHQQAIDQGWISPNAWHLNILQRPDLFSIQTLPAEQKRQVETQIRTFLDRSESLLNNRTKEAYEGVIAFMKQADLSSYLPAFQQEIIQLDQLRKESWADELPELSVLMPAD